MDERRVDFARDCSQAARGEVEQAYRNGLNWVSFPLSVARIAKGRMMTVPVRFARSIMAASSVNFHSSCTGSLISASSSASSACSTGSPSGVIRCLTGVENASRLGLALWVSAAKLDDSASGVRRFRSAASAALTAVRGSAVSTGSVYFLRCKHAYSVGSLLLSTAARGQRDETAVDLELQRRRAPTAAAGCAGESAYWVRSCALSRVLPCAVVGMGRWRSQVERPRLSSAAHSLVCTLNRCRYTHERAKVKTSSPRHPEPLQLPSPPQLSPSPRRRDGEMAMDLLLRTLLCMPPRGFPSIHFSAQIMLVGADPRVDVSDTACPGTWLEGIGFDGVYKRNCTGSRQFLILLSFYCSRCPCPSNQVARDLKAGCPVRPSPSFSLAATRHPESERRPRSLNLRRITSSSRCSSATSSRIVIASASLLAATTRDP